MKKMKKLLLILSLIAPLTLMAEDRANREWRSHEIRVGYGDPLYETMVWHDSPTYFTLEQTFDYHYTGHIFAEYHYRQNDWFSYGGMIDYQQVWWMHEMPGDNEPIFSTRYFFDISLMPTIRFTFFWHEWVNLYCGLGAGMLINSGSETDYRGRTTAVAPVLNLSLLGLSIGRDMFFGTFELGGMFSLTNGKEIYMVGSRLFSVSIGVRL